MISNMYDIYDYIDNPLSDHETHNNFYDGIHQTYKKKHFNL